MKRFLVIFGLLFILPLAAHATSVTATVTDAGGQSWNNGTWSATLVNKPGFFPPNNGYLIAGTNTQVPNQHGISGALDGTGAFSTTLTDVQTIAPAGATWRIQVCPRASAPCFVAQVDVTGASENVSSFLVPPAIVIDMTVPAINYEAYSDSEVINGNLGLFFWNLTLNALRICNTLPCGWGSLGTGGTNYQAVQGNGSTAPAEPALNLIAGTNVTVGCVDNSGVSTDCTISSTGGTGGLSGMSAGQIPLAASSSTVTSSVPIQGTDANLLSSGTISGLSASLCTDANGGATTAGCPVGGTNYQIVQSNGTTAPAQPTLNLISGTNSTVGCVNNVPSNSTDCTISSTGGGGGTPGGANGNVQYKNGAAFGGASGITTPDGNILSIKGPSPWVDIASYGAVAGTSSGLTTTTATINSASHTATVGTTAFANGNGITILGAGATTGMSTPPSVFIAQAEASATTLPQETSATYIASPTASSTYVYTDFAVDKFGGKTAASATTTITDGQPTLGKQTCTISTITNSGDTETVTCTTSPQLLAVGAKVHIDGVTPAAFDGWFNVTTVNNGAGTFTVANTGIDTTKGAPTSATGGTAVYYLGNKIDTNFPFSVKTNVWEYGICAQRPGDGALHLIGMTAPNATGGYQTDSFYDWGATLLANQTFPYFVSDADCTAVAATPDPLTTIVTAGGGTTTLTLQDAAGTSVSGATAYMDDGPPILAAANASVTGTHAPLYISPLPVAGGVPCWPIYSYTTLPLNVNVLQGGALCLRATLQLPQVYNWTGKWSLSGPPGFAQDGGAAIYVQGANPGIYSANAVSSSTSDVNISTLGSTNGGILWLSDDGQFLHWNNMSFETNQSNAADYIGLDLVLRSDNSGGNNYYTSNVSFLGGPSQVTDSTWAPNVFLPTGVNNSAVNVGTAQILKIINLSMSTRGFASEGCGQTPANVTIQSGHRQGGIVPLISIYNCTGAAPAYVSLENLIQDTETAGTVALLSAPGPTVNLRAYFNHLFNNSAEAGGIPPAISGQRVTSVDNIQSDITVPYINTTNTDSTGFIASSLIDGRYFRSPEGTAPSGVSGYDILYPDSTAHRWKMTNNNGTTDTVAGLSEIATGGCTGDGVGDLICNTFTVKGATSGFATIVAAVNQGTPAEICLPTVTANPGYVLASDGTSSPCQQLTWIPASGTGTVTNVATTSPVLGGPITTTGTISCPTCTTSASALTSGLPIVGSGAQAMAVGTKTGTTTLFPTFNGAATPARCVDVDASGNLQVTAADCNTGSGVTNIATTSPITGGPITTTGTIACATCAVTSGTLAQFAATTSAQLAGVLSDESGTGVVAFTTNPVFTTPNLGTPSAINLTNATGAPTWNQNTTGSAAKWTTARALAGNSVDGSVAVPFANKFVVQGTVDAGLTGAQFLGALGTGLVKNTTTTGVLSIATSGDVIGLWSGTCNATTFLEGDGACATPAGTGTVTNVATSAPLGGGPITTTGTLTCATCVTSAAALTANAVVIGGGLQASSTIAADTNTAHALFATAGAPAFRAVVAGDIPTLNQNTTGTAAAWTTARNLAGNSVDGTGNVAFANKFIVQGTVDAGLSGAQFLGALGTGILKNTTTTGVLSDAASADVIGLWTGTCNNTTFLDGSGACSAPSGSGTVNSGTAGHLAYYATSTNAVSDMGADFTFSTHTLTGGSSSILDLGAAPVAGGLLIPKGAAASPTADGQVANNTTNHTFVWGSNGTTMVGAIAATGTGTATDCTTEFISKISSLAVPTCSNTLDLSGGALTLPVGPTPGLDQITIDSNNNVHTQQSGITMTMVPFTGATSCLGGIAYVTGATAVVGQCATPAGGTIAGGQVPLVGTFTSPQQGQVVAVNSSGVLTNQWLGTVPNPQTGTTYTVAGDPGGDRGKYISTSNAGAIAVTLPQAGTTGFANNFFFRTCDIGAGTATWTPTTSTISYSNGAAYTSGASTMPLTTGQCAWVYSDNTNYFAVVESNGGSNITKTICSGTMTLGTTAMASGTKFGTNTTTPLTATCTGALTSDNVMIDFASDPSGVTGYSASASGTLTIIKWVTANTINLYQYNDTGASVTPGAMTVNYRVVR